ncbi:MAG: 30S ribosomal protein S6 [Chlamydiales bacterium]|nr:30S ribosomal protein S6 [Chlamydiales bacterium]
MSKNEKSTLYEGMFIANAALSEDARKKFLEKLHSGITSKGGEIKNEIDMGRKKLAYQIRGHREGYYYLLYFTAPSSQIKELWNDYHLNEDLIRFMTLKTEEARENLEFQSLGSGDNE